MVGFAPEIISKYSKENLSKKEAHTNIIQILFKV